MNASYLPTLNAVLNSISFILLLIGYSYIRKGNPGAHKKLMLSALVSSAVFLTSYLIYHYNVGSVPYPYHDWTRPVYFIILVPHIILAALMTPFILVAVVYALRGNFQKHRKIARWVFPVWIFVSISGVIIYLMLYIF
ncbi:MAG: DUF420 domain-containing protein [candidate division Zixibacteria bacterium]|nr:DUF420 domain-containing protein [candidate division Zixibacteria bacterium]